MDNLEAEWRKRFGRNLLDTMNRWKISQEELSLKTGISQSAISKYINGVSTPSAYTLMKICDVLELPYDFVNWD